MSDDEISVDGYDDMDMAELALSKEPNFDGHQPRECGEHRTVGSHRAWCYACTEWCYPRIAAACRGCQMPVIEKLLDDMAAALTLFPETMTQQERAVMDRYREFKGSE